MPGDLHGLRMMRAVSIEHGAFDPMCGYRLIRSQCTPLPAILAVALVMLFVSVNAAQAGILLPQPIGFDAKDLDQSLSDNHASGSSSSSTPQESQQWPPSDNDQQPSPLGLLNAPLPAGHSSSNTSTSSSGGAAGSGMALCLLNGTISVTDDLALGRLAEDHGLSLPDPPGTDLLRPPRG